MRLLDLDRRPGAPGHRKPTRDPDLVDRGRGRPAGWSALAAAGVLGLGAAAARLVVRVEVEGQSMVPTLLPGDRLLVVRGVRGVRGVGIVPLRVGSIVALPDPRSPSLLLVKRVHAIDGDRLDVRGDDPLHSTDSRTFGTVPLRSTLGRVVWRYAPPSRAGRVGGRPPTVGPGGAAVGAAGGPEGGAEGGGR